MNHDITHCNGEGCPMKELCYRYIAHKDQSDNGNNRKYVEAEHCMDMEFALYWRMVEMSERKIVAEGGMR